MDALPTERQSTVNQQLGTTYHFFADDLQLHDSAAPSPSEFSSLVRDMTSSIEEVGIWMKGNKLKMNDDKTELIAIGFKAKAGQHQLYGFLGLWDWILQISTESWVCSWMSLSQRKCRWISCVKFYISSFVVESVRSILSWLLMPKYIGCSLHSVLSWLL